MIKYILFLLALVGAYFFTVDSPSSTDETRLLGQIDLPSVERLIIRGVEGVTSIEKEEGAWVIREMEDFPADAGKVKATLLELASLPLAPSINNIEGWGLDEEDYDSINTSFSVFVGTIETFFGKKGDRHAARVGDSAISTLRAVVSSSALKSWMAKSIDFNEKGNLPVKQFRVNEQGEEVLEFEIAKTENGKLELVEEYLAEEGEQSELVFNQISGVLTDIRISGASKSIPENAQYVGRTEITGVNDNYVISRSVVIDEDPPKYFVSFTVANDDTWFEDWVFEVPGYIYNRMNVTLTEINTP